MSMRGASADPVLTAVAAARSAVGAVVRWGPAAGRVRQDALTGAGRVRAVVQRVTRASVTVDDEVVGSIGDGLRVLLGVTHDDGPALHGLRILPGELSCADTGAALQVVSQFTLYGDTRKGRRPSWTAAAPGAVAESLVEAVRASRATPVGQSRSTDKAPRRPHMPM